MTKEVGPNSQPESLFVGNVSNTVSEIQNESPIISQQQIEPINLKYSPEVNHRNRSYLVFGIGIALLIVFPFHSLDGNFLFGTIGTALCCFSFAIAFFMDALYSKGKSDWELSMGQSNFTSTIGMRFDIIIGILCIMIVVMSWWVLL